MPRLPDLLDRIQVRKPCAADWEAMTGGERLRFCEHCAKDVHDISRMTRSEALRLVAASRGNLCVRFARLPDGSVRTSDPAPATLHRIARRASRIAAGAFGAALGLSPAASAPARAAAAVTQGRVEVTPLAGRAAEAAQAGPAVISGTVLDVQGAAVPGVSVNVVNLRTRETRSASSDGEGAYRFDSLPAGVYHLNYISQGFEPREVTDVDLQQGGERRLDVTLTPRIAVETETMGVMVIREPSDPLVRAAFEGDLPAVEKLLREGHDPNALDRPTDSTALEEAVGRGDLKMVKALLDAGADVNAENRAGRTALMSLGEGATPELLRALLDAGADPNLRDDGGNTALTFAAVSCDAEVVRRLIDAGAKLNLRNDEGRTPVMFAAEQGALGGVRVLVAAGADYNLRDDEGKTALSLAREGEHEAVVELLVSHGAAEAAPEPEEQASQP